MTNYERTVLTNTMDNIEYMLTFFFYDKKENDAAIACLEKARDIIAKELESGEINAPNIKDARRANYVRKS